MRLSIFLYGMEVHLWTDSFSKVYSVSEARLMGDNIVCFFKDFLGNAIGELKSVVFSLGPASFTSTRIINSIIKAISIFNPNVNFTGVSSFLICLYLLDAVDGAIAIPTMRGDFFVSKFESRVLKPMEVLSIEDESVVFIDSIMKHRENIARVQDELLRSDVAIKNPKFISDSIDVEYGFSPEYKVCQVLS